MMSSGQYLVNTSNLAHANTILARTYGLSEICVSQAKSTPKVSVWRTIVGPLAVDEVEISTVVHFAGLRPDSVYLCRMRSGTSMVADGLHTEEFGPGDISVIGAGDDYASYVGQIRATRCDVISFGRQLLAEATAGPGASARMQVCLNSTAPVDHAAKQHLIDVVDHIRRAVASNPLAAVNARVVNSAARYLASTVLATIAHRVQDRTDATQL